MALFGQSKRFLYLSLKEKQEGLSTSLRRQQSENLKFVDVGEKRKKDGNLDIAGTPFSTERAFSLITLDQSDAINWPRAQATWELH